MHWSSKVLKRYKRNAVLGDLHRAKRIANDFTKEKEKIRQKFSVAGFPGRFTESVIRDFEGKDQEYLQPGQGDNKILYRLTLPFCEENEKLAPKLIDRLNHFTGGIYKFFIIWTTRKIKTLFPLKDKKRHDACVIYEGTCDCNENYIGETERNLIIRTNKQKQKQKFRTSTTFINP